MKNRGKSIKIKLVFIVILIFILSACNAKEQTNEIQVMEAERSKLKEAQTLKVKRGNVEEYLLLEARIVPNVYQKKFETLGKFKEYKVNIGDSVTKGQELAVLDDSIINDKINELTLDLEDLAYNYEFNIANCNKTIASYKVEMAANHMLVNKEYSALGKEETNEKSKQIVYTQLYIEKEELKKAHFQQTYTMEKEYIEEQLDIQKKKLSKLQITAPCDGNVIALQEISQGDEVKREDYYIAIAEKDSYYMQCDYLSADYAESIKEIYAVRSGKKYNIQYVPMDEDIYFAILNNDGAKYSNFSIEQKDENIKYGNSFFIKLVNDKSENVLVIPNICIGDDKDGRYVYKQTEDKKEKVYITIGLTDKITTEVKEGLEEGDIIYVQE